MLKIALAALGVAFAAAALTAPAMAAKKKGPGMCGTYMYYDMKKKKCADKRG